MKNPKALLRDALIAALCFSMQIAGLSKVYAQSLCSADASAYPNSAVTASMDELAYNLQTNKLVRDAAIFVTAQGEFTQAFVSALEDYFVSILVQLGPLGTVADREAIESALGGLNATNAGLEIAAFITGYWQARNPTKVGLFYTTLDKTDLTKLPGTKNKVWLLPKQQERLLHVYIIPEGDSLKVLTPKGLADVLAARIGKAVPKAVNKILYNEIISKAVHLAVDAGFEAASKTFLSSNVVEDSYKADEEWRISKEKTYQFHSSKFAGMEIGDIKVICLFRAPPPNIIGERVASDRIIFKGIATGDVRLQVEVRPEYADIFYEASKSAIMAIHVDGEQSQSPNLAEPMPFEIQLPLVAPKLAQPSLAPGTPVANPKAPAPVAKEPPAWTPCGERNEGTFSPYTHKCEYPH